MKVKYPAEAFALAILLFCAGMQEAFAAGSLVLLAAVFGLFLNSLLENRIPDLYRKLCVAIGTASVSGSVFLLGFAALGYALSLGTWLLTFFIGLLCARWALTDGAETDYGALFFDSAVAWGFWILLAIAREFMGEGKIFGYLLLDADFQSKAFLGSTFAFLTTGLVLAFTNGVLKKGCKGFNSLLVVLPAAIIIRPFTVDSVGEMVNVLWTILVPVVLFLSVKKTLQFSRIGRTYRGLPAELLSAGFIYMILSIY